MRISSFPTLVLTHFFLLFIAHAHSLNSDESSSLLALKAYISPEPQNVLANNWTTATSVCKWIGVICGGRPQRVIALNLSSMGLNGTLPPIGTIPSALGSITSLKKIDFSNNTLSGSIASSIFNVSSLQIINLSFNRLDGSLTTDMFDYLPYLKELFLSRNQLYGQIPGSLFNCRQLEVLSLSSNNFIGNIPLNLGNLTILSHLDLNSNNLEGHIPSSICNCTSLKAINFSENNFEGALPSDIGLFLPNLLELQLRGNELHGTIPSSLFNASKLTLLDLSDNSFTGHIPTTIGSLKNLQKLDLGHNQLTSESSYTPGSSFINSLTNNRHLRKIVLSGNPLATMLPMSIGNLSTSLEYLELTDCRLKGIIPTEVGSLSSLISLKLGNNALTGVIPDTIGRLKNLQSLQLHGNKLQGHIPYDLCMLRNLFELFLGGNELSGAIPECLTNLSALRNLSLSSNKLTSTIPSSLWSLVDILAINLSSNSLHGSLSSGIGNLKAGIEIDLSINNLSGQIPYNIGDLKNLAYLSLAENRLQGPIPERLSLSVALVFLDLSRNNLSGVIPKSLENLHYLIYFNVSFNDLEGEIPSAGSFTNFKAQSYVMNKALCGAARLQVRSCRTGKISWKTILFFGMLPMIVYASIYILAQIYRMRKHHMEKKKEQLLTTNRTIMYQEIVLATDGFSESNLLGTGSYGSVYKGTMKEEKNVAIKVFNLHLERGLRSFQVESKLLAKVCHPNLVKLMNSCCDDDFRALVLEYMPNGTLDKWLYTHNYFLNLLQRLDIMIEVTSAMNYLHLQHIIHCDLKPSNVLLDEDMVARVSDFSIAKLVDAAVQTTTMATIGYMAPEHGSSGIVSEKTDVYSFGILLMETFTGKKPTDDIFNGEMNLRRWVHESLPHAVDTIIDSTLLQSDQEDITAKTKCIYSILKLAWFCTAESFSDRKTMAEVESELFKIKTHFLIDTQLMECDDISIGRGVRSCSLRDNELTVFEESRIDSRISLQELKLATDGFSERNLLDLGKSSFVYKGTLEDMSLVAIKIFNLQKGGLEKFKVHFRALSSIRHRNVVKIVKYCSDVDFKALVVEYMSNGSLQSHLLSGMNALNFQQRLDIMINVASGLCYLHSMHVIHCNLNPTNVLLDKDMVARISGFSFAKCLEEGIDVIKTSRMAVAPGYMTPEYESIRTVSEKTDVYSFGILLMETFTVIKPAEEMDWRSRICYSLQSVDKIVDLNILQTDMEDFAASTATTSEFLRSILGLIYCCTAEFPLERKTMTEVESALARLKKDFCYSIYGADPTIINEDDMVATMVYGNGRHLPSS